MNPIQLSSTIIKLLGGKENITSVTNCTTRLRIHVKDELKIELTSLKQLEDVLGVITSQHYIEIVVGPGKSKKCADIINSMISKANIHDVLKTIGQIFAPILPGIIVAGMSLTLSTIFKQVFPFYENNQLLTLLIQLLEIIHQAFVLFLPCWIGYLASSQLNATPILGSLLGILTILQYQNGTILIEASGDILGVLVGVYVLSIIERIVRRYMIENIDHIVSPFIAILLTSLLLLKIIMPLSSTISIVVCDCVMNLCLNANIYIRLVVGFILAASFLQVVSKGYHHVLVLLYCTMLVRYGFICLFPVLAMAGAGQVGAGIALYLKAKKQKNHIMANKIKKAVPQGLLGIGEPLVYGVTRPLHQPFITAGIGAGFGGAFVMMCKVTFTAWGPSGLLGLVVLSNGTNTMIYNFLYYLLGLFISILMAFMITSMKIPSSLLLASRNELYAMCEGMMISPKDILDETFSSEMIGQTIAIEPTSKDICSPIDGVIESIYPTQHAFTLRMEDGTGLLIHIGIDTVKLNGKGFVYHKKQGDKIKVGECIVSVDLDAIKSLGYQVTTLLIVSENNHEPYTFIQPQKVTTSQILTIK